MALDTSTITKALKELYEKDNAQDVIAKSMPLVTNLAKGEKFEGKNMPVVPRYGCPETVNYTFSAAQTAAASESSKWGRFEITGVTKHAVAVVSGDAMAQAASDKGGFIMPLKNEIDGAMHALAMRRSGEIFSAGWGEVGIIDAASISGATLKLTTKSAMQRVEVGHSHVFSSALNSAALRASGGALKVIAVDRASRTITYNANVSTLSGVVAGDYVFHENDRQDSSSPSRRCIAGLEAWIPTDAPTSGDSFFGQDRSVDPTRLAGQRLDASTGTSLEETLQEADAIVSAEGGNLDLFVVSPVTFKNLSIAMGTRVRYQPVAAGRIGFSSILVNGQSGDINVMSDRFCPDDRIYGLQSNTWEILSSGKLVGLNDDDKNPFLRQGAADAIEARLVSRLAQLVCRAPAFNINVKIA